MSYQKTLLLTAVLLLFPSVAHCASKTIGASKDNTIFQNAVNNSAGGAAGIFSGSNNSNPPSPRRGLLAFEIAANLPSGATITGAQLTMYQGFAANISDQAIGLYRLNADWGEGTAGSSTPGISGGGGGFPAGTGDATWNARFLGSTNWTTPGADYNPVASASAVVGGLPDTTASLWLSTPALVGDVQSWLNNPATNFGWALINADEVTGSTVKVFYSRSATQKSSGGMLNPAWRPTLLVTYVPEPSAAMLLVLAGPLVFILRRR